MKVIYNIIIPFKGFKAINLFGVLFVRKGSSMDAKDLNHEAIHSAQMKELWYVVFYVWYVLEWVRNLFIYQDAHTAYREIKFEREAYINERIQEYLSHREKFSFLKYK